MLRIGSLSAEQVLLSSDAVNDAWKLCLKGFGWLGAGGCPGDALKFAVDFFRPATPRTWGNPEVKAMPRSAKFLLCKAFGILR